MHRFGIEDEIWFDAARTGLEALGFRLRLQPRAIVIDKDGRLPRILVSARAVLEFAERQGLSLEPGALEAADLYGDERSDTTGRASDSPFEVPVAGFAPVRLGGGLADAAAEEFSAGLFGGSGVRAARRPELAAVEARLGEIRRDQEQLAAERRAARQVLHEKQKLEARLAALQLEVDRAGAAAADLARQRDRFQMDAAAAEDRLRILQAEPDAAAGGRGPDRRFDQLRRFLARELHPDLAGDNAAERALREAIFKNIWAKIEQIQ